MARVCICGCGKSLVNKETGLTDYNRKFFDKSCFGNDRKAQLREQRLANKKMRRCSSCGRPVLSSDIWKKLREIAAEAGIEL